MPLEVVEVARKLDVTGACASAYAGSTCTVTCDVPNSSLDRRLDGVGDIDAHRRPASRRARRSSTSAKSCPDAVERDRMLRTSRMSEIRSTTRAKLVGVDRSLVDEHGNRLAKYSEPAPGDDQRDDDRQRGVEPRPVPCRASSSDAERHQRDENVARRCAPRRRAETRCRAHARAGARTRRRTR